jgi:hypothetical protein
MAARARLLGGRKQIHLGTESLAKHCSGRRHGLLRDQQRCAGDAGHHQHHRQKELPTEAEIRARRSWKAGMECAVDRRARPDAQTVSSSTQTFST